MRGALVDTSVILDVMQDDAAWYAWSERALADEMARGTLWINAVIYAEVSIGFARIEEMEAALDRVPLRMRALPREALFLAGKAFLSYRRKGGTRSYPLPDFFIGAHAAVEQFPLITRDPSRVSAYFPGVRLICPEQPASGK